MKIWFDFKKKLRAAILTADTPHLRKLLLNCFTVASMTKLQFKQNTSEKLDYTGIVASRGSESFSRLNQKIGQNKKT